jgi:hypothetical protein
VQRANLNTLSYTSEICEWRTGFSARNVSSEISGFFFADGAIKQPGKQLHQTKAATKQQVRQPHKKAATQQNIKQLHQTEPAIKQQVSQPHKKVATE